MLYLAVDAQDLSRRSQVTARARGSRSPSQRARQRTGPDAAGHSDVPAIEPLDAAVAARDIGKPLLIDHHSKPWLGGQSPQLPKGVLLHRSPSLTRHLDK